MQSRLQTQVQKLIEKPKFLHVIIILILLNSIVLGLESYPNIMKEMGSTLIIIDDIMLFIFVAELSLYLYTYGTKKCLTDPWYLFDATVISVAIFSVNPAYSSLRAMRVLRILRLISAFPNLRRVVEGLLKAIPDITSIFTILGIVLYVGSLMATNLYGEEFPEYFGTLGSSVFSLFQILTTEGWPDIVRPIMSKYPHSWMFFITYLFAATFIVLNLFIAVIVDAMQKSSDHLKEERNKAKEINEIQAKLEQIYKIVKKL